MSNRPTYTGVYCKFNRKFLIYLLLLGSTLPSAAENEITRPDIRTCSFVYGALTRTACDAALQGIPTGELPTIFTSRRRISGTNFVSLPKRYADSEAHPSCVITIDFDGRSENNAFVSIPWDKVREKAQIVLDDCVGAAAGWGGYATYGLKKTFQALLDNTPASGLDRPQPAQVIEPDGSFSDVAIPTDVQTPAKGIVLIATQGIQS